MSQNGVYELRSTTSAAVDLKVEHLIRSSSGGIFPIRLIRRRREIFFHLITYHTFSRKKAQVKTEYRTVNKRQTIMICA